MERYKWEGLAPGAARKVGVVQEEPPDLCEGFARVRWKTRLTGPDKPASWRIDELQLVRRNYFVLG